MNKRGQGLSLTMVIVAILVVLVLVVVVVFFLGGMTGIKEKIAQAWGKGIAGTDITLAAQNCQNYCDQAKMLPSDGLKKKSAFCTVTFNLDLDGNGEADKDNGNYKKFYCWGKTLNIPCETELIIEVREVEVRDSTPLGPECDTYKENAPGA